MSKAPANASALDEGGTRPRPPLGLYIYPPMSWIALGVGIGFAIEAGHSNSSALVEMIAAAALFLVTIFGILGFGHDDRRYREALTRPPLVPPGGVVAVMADGREIPLDCLYEGWEPEANGYHVWRAATDMLHEKPVMITVKEEPAATKIMGTFRETAGRGDEAA